MMAFKGYRITSKYGWRNHPDGTGRKFHAGVDLSNYHKAPIKPFVSGKVIYAGRGRSGTGTGNAYGNLVIIKDNKGHAHLYAHLDSVLTHKGDIVNTNTVIGYQGQTGNAIGSHLHYEIRKKSSPNNGWDNDRVNSTLDPIEFLKGGDYVGKQVLKVDGHLGPATIKRLQQFLGTTQDGKISKPSLMVKELQRFLNKYGQ